MIQPQPYFKFFRITGIFVWVVVMFLIGSYIRTRDGTEMVEVDWLVITQVITCILAGILGLLLINFKRRLGVGTVALFGFMVMALLSMIFSPFPYKVLGYWILLAGVSFLLVGIIQQSSNIRELQQIENAMLLIIVFMLLKDSAVSIFSVVPEGNRLSMGITHANKIGMLAALAFWMSFKMNKNHLLWIIRLVFIIIILLSRSRISMLCLIVGGLSRFWFKQSFFEDKIRITIRFSTAFMITAIFIFLFLALSMNLPGMATSFDWFNRGQDLNKLSTLTGRVEIWQTAVQKIFDDSLMFLFGHGYGVSRFILNNPYIHSDFYFYHSHNTILEIFLSMGAMGILFFTALSIRSLTWLTNIKVLAERFSVPFVLRAVSIISMIFLYSITESDLGTKINPVMMIFFFYTIALDARLD